MPKLQDRDLADDWREDPWDQGTLVDDWAFEPARGRTRSPWKWVVAIVFVLFLGVAAVVGGATLWLMRQINPPGGPGEAVTVNVEPGTTANEVADILKEKGIIESAGVFRWYTGTKGGLQLQPGTFTIRQGDSMDNVIEILETPPAQVFRKVTFPEGSTLAEMGERLQKVMPQLSADRFVAAAQSGDVTSSYLPEGAPPTAMEGLLFPDTYQVSGTESELSVARRMARTFERVADSEKVNEAPQRILRQPYEVVVVASMVEAEAKVAEDRAKIARVIYNRLNLNMPLQIDATVFYAAPGEQSRFAEALELAKGSPYNTYEVLGLPPTPIAAPGRASLRAAMNPAEGDWLYYVLTSADGTHSFTSDYDQFLRWKAEAQAAGLTN